MIIEKEAQKLIQKAMTVGVSDIHLQAKQTQYHVYFRINGQLIPQTIQTLEWGKRLINYFKFLANMDVGERRKPQSGATHWTFEQQNIELRFSTICDVHLNESLVIRLIQSQHQHSVTLNTYFPEHVKILRQLICRKSGLLLFSGPVGSGKTTTIYHLLKERIQKEFIQVMTMEDPVEILEPSFLQTQINEAAQLYYDDLIKAALRHHPDVLVIGEIRDELTAKMTIRGALTGHLMIATVHAKNALGVLARLEELGISLAQLQQTLIGIVAQRLVPRYCPLCQKNCLPHCTHFPTLKKRYALLEILTGHHLESVLCARAPTQFQTLTSLLGKAWSYGYITTNTFNQYQL